MSAEMVELFLRTGDKIQCHNASEMWHFHQRLWALGYNLKCNFALLQIEILGRRPEKMLTIKEHIAYISPKTDMKTATDELIVGVASIIDTFAGKDKDERNGLMLAIIAKLMTYSDVIVEDTSNAKEIQHD